MSQEDGNIASGKDYQGIPGFGNAGGLLKKYASTNQEAMKNRSFWMVYVDGGEPPTFIHAKKEDAVMEAQRLAAKTKKFVYLMRAIEGYRLQESPVVKVNLG